MRVSRLAGALLVLNFLAACASLQAEVLHPHQPATVDDISASGIVVLVNHSASDARLFEGSFCGGVLVSEKVIVTAAHCVEGREPASIDILSGITDLCADQSGTRTKVTTIRTNIGPNQSIALLLTTEAVPSDIAALAIKEPSAGNPLLALGWGRQSIAGVPACALKSISLVVVDSSQCEMLAENPSSAEIVCSLPAGLENTCDGDSGGPVLGFTDSGKVEVNSITMSGVGCGPASPGLNTLITEKLLEEWLSNR